VVTGVDSGPGGRPISIASFLLSAWMGGVTPFAFKAGNLAVHLVNGFLLYALASRLALRDPVYAPRARLAALVLTGVWLLHPLLVSTVLYAVQRMAMLSATFMFAGLLAYVVGRSALEAGRTRAGALWIVVVVPLCTLLAAASKENGLLLPPLCAVLEGCYYRPARGTRRPAVVRAFLLIGVALPLAAAIGLMAWHPAIVLAGYEGRAFTLGQRLLTESRILWDYVGNLLLPWGPHLSLYRDDYVVSTSLLSPPSTVLALAGWLAALLVAWRFRRPMPALAAGLGLYLVGHAMESTAFPLLLYFEHRNYMPAIGILWAAGALLAAGAMRLAPHMQHPRKVFGTGLTLLLLGFTVATWTRVLVWSDKDALLASSLRAHPESRWLRMDLATTALQKTPVDAAGARRNYAALQAATDPVSRQMGAQGQVVVDCGVDGAVGPTKVDALFALSGQPIDVDQYQMLDLLGGLLLRRACAGLPPDAFADRLAHWLDLSPTSDAVRVKKNLRFLAARLYVEAQRYDAARAQAMLDWTNGAKELPVAALLIQLDMQLGNAPRARALLEQVAPTVPPDNVRGLEIFQGLREALQRCSGATAGTPCPGPSS
jgi:hypothetical protein